MAWNGWAQQAYDVFKSVLMRKRFGLKLVSESMDGSKKSFVIRHPSSDDHFSCSVSYYGWGADVTVKESDKDGKVDWRSPFRFTANFPKVRSNPMRKEAVKCARKIMDKSMYDVICA